MVLTAAVFSFLGVVIGASLQYFFSRHLDSLRAHREARTKAYTDYLRCVGELAFPSQLESSDGHELNARTADAKCRVCLYGSTLAISAFARFERLGATTTTPEQRAAFTQMVKIMRVDSASSKSVEESDVRMILFGMAAEALDREPEVGKG